PRRPPSTLFPYTTLFRSETREAVAAEAGRRAVAVASAAEPVRAGAAMVPLRVPSGTPLAGYGSLRRRLLVPDLLGLHPHAFWFRDRKSTRLNSSHDQISY